MDVDTHDTTKQEIFIIIVIIEPEEAEGTRVQQRRDIAAALLGVDGLGWTRP